MAIPSKEQRQGQVDGGDNVVGDSVNSELDFLHDRINETIDYLGTQAQATASSITVSEIWLYAQNGNGSTNTDVSRWSTIGKNVGTDLALAQDAALGDSITINTTGRYAITVGGSASGTANFGATINSIVAGASIHTVVYFDSTSAQLSLSGGTVVNLNAGDIVRSTSQGTQQGDTRAFLRVTRVS